MKTLFIVVTVAAIVVIASFAFLVIGEKSTVINKHKCEAAGGVAFVFRNRGIPTKHLCVKPEIIIPIEEN